MLLRPLPMNLTDDKPRLALVTTRRGCPPSATCCSVAILAMLGFIVQIPVAHPSHQPLQARSQHTPFAH
jgi:hypothetical protein